MGLPGEWHFRRRRFFVVMGFREISIRLRSVLAHRVAPTVPNTH
jgi:hypothetical protein